MPKTTKNAIYIGAESKRSLYDLVIPDNWNGKLIIFIHGYMGYKDWGCWNLVQAFFEKNDFGFLKYNVSHNGGTVENTIDFSDLDSFSKNNYLFEILDLESILSIVRDEFTTLPEIYLIGHSRGGGIALLQSKNPLIQKICTWAAISNIEKRFPKGEDLKKWETDGVYFRENGRTKQQMPHSYSQYTSFLENSDRLNIENACRNSKTTTLVIHGTDDTSVGIEEGREIASWLGTKLASIEGEQHTFGSSQPWNKTTMPNGLKRVCNLTLSFFNSTKEASKNHEDNEKLSMLSDLVKLAESDSTIRDVEFQFLLSIARQLGVTREDFKKLFEQYIEFTPPKFESDRIVQFQRLILLMNVDLEKDVSELNYIRDIGIKMGLHPSATNEILRRMNEFEDKIIPPNELIDIFKTFHN